MHWQAIVSVYGIALLVAKLIAVVFLTGFARRKARIPAAPEDLPETRGEALSVFSSYDKSGMYSRVRYVFQCKK
mgnify:CR=1 FL=1